MEREEHERAIVESAIQNYHKHLWALVRWCRRVGKDAVDLERILAVGSTVANEIWARYSKMEIPPIARDGAIKICLERRRQIEAEFYTPEHDDDHHYDGSLAWAAVCYAAPTLVYRRKEYANGISFEDPFPWPATGADKRFQFALERGEAPTNVTPCNNRLSDEQRVDLLTKAGALIAAEIDRLERKRLRAKDAAVET